MTSPLGGAQCIEGGLSPGSLRSPGVKDADGPPGLREAIRSCRRAGECTWVMPIVHRAWGELSGHNDGLGGMYVGHADGPRGLGGELLGHDDGLGDVRGSCRRPTGPEGGYRVMMFGADGLCYDCGFRELRDGRGSMCGEGGPGGPMSLLARGDRREPRGCGDIID